MRPESTVSPDARPPVQRDEAEAAPDSICPYHKGLVTLTGEREGAVFWCPIGRQYWRYRKNTNDGFRTRLRYPKIGVV
jgi:hypothetical protein